MPIRERVESPLRAAQEGAAEPAAAAAPAPAPAAGLPLRELSGWEEEYLERHAGEPNTAALCNEVLARCLVAPGQDFAAARERVRALLVAERDRELVALRRMSLGAQVSARVRCPECGEDSEAEFSLDDLPLDFDAPREPVRVAVDGVGDAVLRLPTAGDQEDLAAAGLDGAAERRSWLIARCLERFGERDGGFDLAFARGLPVGVRAALERALEERLPELDLQMAVNCSHCDADVIAPFDVPVFFFAS